MPLDETPLSWLHSLDYPTHEAGTRSSYERPACRSAPWAGVCDPARRISAVKAAVAATALALATLPMLVACGGAGDTVRADGTPGPAAPSSTPRATAATSRVPSAASARVPTVAAPPTPDPMQALARLRPRIHRWPIPFGDARKREMAAYSLRHYGEDTYVLSKPKVIVEHYTETATAQEAYNTFAPDVPDSEFGELPNTCAHFLVESDGHIDQLVALALRCRHTTGLNWTAIGIENVGFSDAQILDDSAQIAASLRLTRWLRCAYGIALSNVIGHNESLSSRYHRDRVPAFQHQTHSDFDRADMHIYRARLARLKCPAGSFARSAQSDTGGV
jgi:N-acetylmuramoyl-L-alanine amidase